MTHIETKRANYLVMLIAYLSFQKLSILTLINISENSKYGKTLLGHF